jgi:predicted DNA-binding ribbon-helix-helix protein
MNNSHVSCSKYRKSITLDQAEWQWLKQISAASHIPAAKTLLKKLTAPGKKTQPS